MGVRAQEIEKRPDEGWQIELTRRYNQLHEQTLRLARQHHWPLRKVYGSGREARLQEVDPLGHPIYYTLHNTEAARATHTQTLYAGGALGLYLSGNSPALKGKFGLWDGGAVLSAHRELAGRIQQKDKTSLRSDHATHVAGTLIARGVNPAARGMAFGADLLTWDYTSDLTELATVAKNLLISNHSYGPVLGWVFDPTRPGTDDNLKWEWWGNTEVSQVEDYLFGFYSTKARDIDQIAFNNPYYLMVRSADNKHNETGPPAGTAYYLRNTSQTSTLPRLRNDGYDVIPAEATAKNILTIGAGDLTLTASNPVATLTVSPFSGWGPTDDGRIKPDLLGMGTHVFSCVSTDTAAYTAYSGTSMASANVAGSLLLLQELYTQRHPNQFMRSATLRGVAIHTADRPNLPAGPTYALGWGLLNLEAAARVILNTDGGHFLAEGTLPQGQSITRQLVAQGHEPLVVTVCWTDPEAPATSVSASNVNNRIPKLVNDLDLRVSDGQMKAFPFVLAPDQPTQAAVPGDNTRDNVEQVFIEHPLPGKTYTVTVTHKNRLIYGAQPYSVLASGLQRTGCSITAKLAPDHDTLICAGAQLQLTTQNLTGLAYEWLHEGQPIPGAATAQYQASQAGYYAVRVTDQAGCSATSPAIKIETRAPTVPITPASDQWLCSDVTAVTFTTTAAPGLSIDWLRDGQVLAENQSATLIATQAGRYQVRLNQPGCSALSPVVNVRPSTLDSIRVTPEDNILTLPRGATMRLQAPIQSDYVYQWLRNDQRLTHATGNYLIVSQPGSYQVRISQRACTGLSAAKRVFWADGGTSSADDSLVLAIDPEARILLSPNPASSVLSVAYTHPLATDVWLNVGDERGLRLRSTLRMHRQGTTFQLDIPVSDWPSGVYLFRLIDGPRTWAGRFLKQ